MTIVTEWATWRRRYPSAPYLIPFLSILFFIAIRPYSAISDRWEWPLQVIAAGALCLLCWPSEMERNPRHWLGSAGIGLLVFALWIAPDRLFPGYRAHVLFSNALLGKPHSTLPTAAQRDVWVLFWRTMRATLVVPIAEELFWRAWLMRWLADNRFWTIPLGSFTPFAFFLTAALFASEHGPYWDVGLVTGCIYNLWMVKTKSLADCVLMHAVTNGILSVYVIASGSWQYWM